MSVQELCIKPPDASSESNRPQLIPDVRSGHAVKSFETILNVKSLWSVPIFTSLLNENLELFRNSNVFSLSLCIRHVYEHSFLWMTFLTLHYASASVLGNSNLGPVSEVQSLKVMLLFCILGSFFYHLLKFLTPLYSTGLCLLFLAKFDCKSCLCLLLLHTVPPDIVKAL